MTLVLPFVIGYRVFSLNYTDLHLEHLLARIGLLGIVGVNILSGFGCLELPYVCLSDIRVSESYVRDLYERYRVISAEITALQREERSSHQAQSHLVRSILNCLYFFL